MKRLILSLAIFGIATVNGGLTIQEYEMLNGYEKGFNEMPEFMKKSLDEEILKYEKEAKKWYPNSATMREIYIMVKVKTIITKISGE